MSFNRAISSKTRQIYFGSFFSPRCGCGVRYGESVSINNLSSGTTSATSFGVFALVKVTVPPKAMFQRFQNSSALLRYILECVLLIFQRNLLLIHGYELRLVNGVHSRTQFV